MISLQAIVIPKAEEEYSEKDTVWVLYSITPRHGLAPPTCTCPTWHPSWHWDARFISFHFGDNFVGKWGISHSSRHKYLNSI